MPAEQGLCLKTIDASIREGQQPVEADEDQTICSLQPRSDRRRPLQDNELLAAGRGSQLRRRACELRNHANSAGKKSLNTDHSAKSLNRLGRLFDRLDKFSAGTAAMDIAFIGELKFG